MFTGIVTAVGQVTAFSRQRNGARLSVAVPAAFLSATAAGDSIAVSGCCLTAAELLPARGGRAGFRADLARETLRRTRFSQLRRGEAVNLELPLRVGQPLGGHLVQAHVDGVGFVAPPRRRERGRLAVRIPVQLLPLVAPQGSLAVEGVSLTVAALEEDRAEFAIIPHTRTHTNLGQLRPGDAVNLEADLLARYLARLTGAPPAGGMPGPAKRRSPAMASLRRQGF